MNKEKGSTRKMQRLELQNQSLKEKLWACEKRLQQIQGYLTDLLETENSCRKSRARVNYGQMCGPHCESFMIEQDYNILMDQNSMLRRQLKRLQRVNKIIHNNFDVQKQQLFKIIDQLKIELGSRQDFQILPQFQNWVSTIDGIQEQIMDLKTGRQNTESAIYQIEQKLQRLKNNKIRRSVNKYNNLNQKGENVQIHNIKRSRYQNFGEKKKESSPKKYSTNIEQKNQNHSTNKDNKKKRVGYVLNIITKNIQKQSKFKNKLVEDNIIQIKNQFKNALNSHYQQNKRSISFCTKTDLQDQTINPENTTSFNLQQLKNSRKETQQVKSQKKSIQFNNRQKQKILVFKNKQQLNQQFNLKQKIYFEN